jgi:hypothetical protein
MSLARLSPDTVAMLARPSLRRDTCHGCLQLRAAGDKQIRPFVAAAVSDAARAAALADHARYAHRARRARARPHD